MFGPCDRLLTFAKFPGTLILACFYVTPRNFHDHHLRYNSYTRQNLTNTRKRVSSSTDVALLFWLRF